MGHLFSGGHKAHKLAVTTLSAVSPPPDQHRRTPSHKASPRNLSEREDGNPQPSPNFASMQCQTPLSGGRRGGLSPEEGLEAFTISLGLLRPLIRVPGQKGSLPNAPLPHPVSRTPAVSPLSRVPSPAGSLGPTHRRGSCWRWCFLAGWRLRRCSCRSPARRR